ncbi:phosphoglycolate phosphatase [Sulfuritalea hydrogenivorans]|jgi:phosphoglycolate phosphatase|uniref:Phosphoglycolate phosphatase n=1 Tax=Sulfuritalea hydrogenivorans sk43H TaxID=1223802 RepID=W0SIH7_9PROT|nr:phosphoglycolate phosphatase [Sulfuritalea hydrogenivorans]MDK9714273.1 phosphoglycolate phosphatase [Sulfuritalea sp.]BAO30657.1 phosphoglycolate phosphatase [Sulfuritalea hydrogenivorans sk43H]
MKPIRSVTIDLDGTLLDTVPDLAAAANAMLREMGRPEFSIETIAAFIGRGIPKLVARCLPDLDEAAVDQAQVIFRRHYAIENGRRSALFPGVLEGLQALRAAGLPLAVITNKAAAFTEPLLVATQLAPWFRFAVSGDTLAHKKPHPAQLLHACERMGTLPAENLHIGDSHHDAVAARAAGCPVFIVPYGYNEGEDVQGIDCDAIVASLAEAARRIASADFHDKIA